MKRFQNSTVGITKLVEAIRIAESDLHPESELMDLVVMKNDWKYNSGTGKEVYLKLTQERPLVSVYVAHATRKTKALGMYSNGVITFYWHYLETATIDELVRSLRHEYAHYCGLNHYSAFGTSNFKTKDKCLYSVPYWLSEYGKPAVEIICTRNWKSLWFKRCYEVSRTMNKYTAFDYSTGMSLE